MLRSAKQCSGVEELSGVGEEQLHCFPRAGLQPVVVTPPAPHFLSSHLPLDLSLPRSPNKHSGKLKFYQPPPPSLHRTNLQVLTYSSVMSRSGIGLAKDVVENFEELKLGKKLAYILYNFSPDNKVIAVEKKVEKDAQKTPKEQYEEFIDALPATQCRYAIYDFTYDLPNGEGTRNKIVFFAWSPDDAPVRNKMLCASSKDSLRRSLTGVAAEIQGTDYSEITFDVVLQRFAGKQTT
ncbi:unnamed protein product [Tuber melanosporum]|uniref:Cofilin n=1 Tax=Tuber melanosporum (strain Mel28) TaxID=656061 RepID=D5GK32_TUBMM|nr:uncharacterized protein GSTUM_00009340001 [Tuber melanosporum]CAZ84875.1 unnamed protein product [Tuber melanosporum]